jgi:hypothetical protein
VSRLNVEELITTLTQPFHVEYNLVIGGVKPRLLSATPSLTSIKFEIIQDVTTLFSKSLTLAEIKAMGSTTKDNWHGFIPFSSEAAIYLSPGDYELKMSATGYTYSHANFIGWCKERSHYFGKIYGTEPANYTLYPYSYRLIEYKPREL